MNEETLKKIGLKNSDFGDEVKSENDLIESVATSGRLYRKAIQHLVLKDLRIYFDNPQLNYSDDITGHFKYWGRKKSWTDFRDTINFKTPKLRTENFAIFLMIVYLMAYGYYVLELMSKFADFFVHAALSGLALDGLIFLGAIGPFITIFYLGQTELPAKSVDGLVDKIIQENMVDLLTDNKENLKQILKKELSVD
jgi:hypothetical protein